MSNRIFTGVSLDYGKKPLSEELNQRCGRKNVVTIVTNVTEVSLFKTLVRKIPIKF